MLHRPRPSRFSTMKRPAPHTSRCASIAFEDSAQVSIPPERHLGLRPALRTCRVNFPAFETCGKGSKRAVGDICHRPGRQASLRQRVREAGGQDFGKHRLGFGPGTRVLALDQKAVRLVRRRQVEHDRIPLPPVGRDLQNGRPERPRWVKECSRGSSDPRRTRSPRGTRRQEAGRTRAFQAWPSAAPVRAAVQLCPGRNDAQRHRRNRSLPFSGSTGRPSPAQARRT